jgi:HEAT repeat protein
MVRALTNLLDTADPPYLVRAAALQALGTHRGDAHLARLREAATDDGYRSMVRAGALRGLAASRTEEAYRFLRTRVGYGRETDDASPAAAEALGNVAASLPEPIRGEALDDLEGLVRDPRDRVRLAAARGMAKLGRPEAVGILESILKTLALQAHPRIERLIRDVRAKGAPEVAALGKQVEEVWAHCRKLERRLEKLESGDPSSG